MNKLGGFDNCGCRSHFTLGKLQPRLQIEKIVEKFRNVKTQTDQVESREDEITELLTELNNTERKYKETYEELQQTKAEIRNSDDASRESKIKTQEEIVRLMEKNVELESNLSAVKMEFYDEKQKLLTQINELQIELMVKNREGNQKYLDLENNRKQLEERLETVTSDFKFLQAQNESLQSKLYKYKQRIRYLTKFMKCNLIDVKTTETEIHGKDKVMEMKSINTHKQRSVSTQENVSDVTTNNESNKKLSPKRTVPDIENIVLTELFFKPKQHNIDKFSSIYL